MAGGGAVGGGVRLRCGGGEMTYEDVQGLARQLVGAGHDPTKALEIAIEVKRGNKWAIAWCHSLLIGGPRPK
jgi:hypothetical protein